MNLELVNDEKHDFQIVHQTSDLIIYIMQL